LNFRFIPDTFFQFCRKIRRIIFEAVRKWDGGNERSLSVSQVKQIAGRAGRYGLHGDEAPNGLVTTLREPDLPFLASTLNLPAEPLQYARLSPTKESFTGIANALPPGSTTQAIYTAHMYVSRLQPMYRYIMTGENRTFTMCDFVDTYGPKLTVVDRLQLLMAPIPWRDTGCVEIVTKFIQMYSNNMDVKVMEALGSTNYLDTLVGIEAMVKAGMPPRGKAPVLETLESFHKSLVFYLWMSFRNPVSYNRQTEAADLKVRVEKALDWSLEGMSQTVKAQKPQKKWEVTKAEREYGKQIPYHSLTDLKRLGLTASSIQRASRINMISR
jgi:ATP-dependent RNA helicase SUPV3L1/SUV3